MTQPQQTQQHTATAPPVFQEGNAAVAVQHAAGHEQEMSTTFSFDDEPLFAGQDTAAPLPDDFFSSPEWTDPSPALTTSMSFTLDSCDTSPLLTDNYDAPDFSGVPLFGDFQSLYSTDVSPQRPTAKRSPQNAFNGLKDVAHEESTLLLLRALSSQGSAALQAKHGDVANEEQEAVLTASPCAISTPLPVSKDGRPSLSTSSSTQSLHEDLDVLPTSSARGHKRRLDATELLPLDAPIQPRTYKTPSATSRRETAEFAAEEAAIAAEKDPLVAKRLSNTLAARRSRHRKAAELKSLNETIDDLRESKHDLQREMDVWKRRCLRAEAELDRVQKESC